MTLPLNILTIEVLGILYLKFDTRSANILTLGPEFEIRLSKIFQTTSKLKLKHILNKLTQFTTLSKRLIIGLMLLKLKFTEKKKLTTLMLLLENPTLLHGQM